MINVVVFLFGFLIRVPSIHSFVIRECWKQKFIMYDEARIYFLSSIDGSFVFCFTYNFTKASHGKFFFNSLLNFNWFSQTEIFLETAWKTHAKSMKILNKLQWNPVLHATLRVRQNNDSLPWSLPGHYQSKFLVWADDVSWIKEFVLFKCDDLMPFFTNILLKRHNLFNISRKL